MKILEICSLDMNNPEHNNVQGDNMTTADEVLDDIRNSICDMDGNPYEAQAVGDSLISEGKMILLSPTGQKFVVTVTEVV